MNIDVGPSRNRLNRPRAARASRPREAVLCLVAVLTVLAAAYDVLLVRAMWRAHMNDFGKFYYATRHWLDGRNAYAPSPATLVSVSVSGSESREFLDMNPPHFHVLIVPLALAPPVVALVLWFGVGAVSLGLAARVVLRETGPPDARVQSVAASLLVALAFVGTGTMLATGQLAWLLSWPVALAWRDYRRGQWTRAGALLGVVASVKPFVGIAFGLFLGRGRRGALLAGLGAAGGCFLLGFALFGWRTHVAWLEALASANWAWPAMNGSIMSVLARSLSSSPTFTPLAIRPDLVVPAWIALSLVVAGVTLWPLLREWSGADHAFLATLLAALLISPLGWAYYAWFLLPPLAGLLRGGFHRRHRLLLVPVWVAAFWPAAACLLAQPSGWATATVGSVYFWGLVALWLAVVRDWRLVAPPGPAVTVAPAGRALT
jgi:hypothetical protein